MMNWIRGCSALALVLTLGCGGEETAGLECENDDVFARVGETEGCFARCPVGVCSAGSVCLENLCIPTDLVGGNNNTNNPVQTNNSTSPNDPNNPTNNQTTQTNNSTPGSSNGSNNQSNNTNNTNNTNNETTAETNNNNAAQLQALCQQGCDLLYGSCITDNCTLTPEQTTALSGIYDTCLNGDPEYAGCVSEAQTDPDFKLALEELLTSTCDDVSSLRCGEFGLTQECQCAAPTSLGDACTSASDCGAGDLSPLCIPELNSQGQPTGYVGGYCSAGPCPIRDSSITDVDVYSDDSCGEGNLCVVIPSASGPRSYCIQGCDSGCRNGYACQIQTVEPNAQGEAAFVGGCDPGCTSSQDCGTGARCNTLSGRCEVPCGNQPVGSVPGNPTLTELCLNSNGSCIQRAEGFFCSLP